MYKARKVWYNITSIKLTNNYYYIMKNMSKWHKYVKACEFVRDIKAQILENGVTITPCHDVVVVSHKDFGHLGGYAKTSLGMKRLISKTSKDVAVYKV